jgi:hypothetical protein
LRTSGLLDVVRPEMFSLAERVRVTVALAKVTANYDQVMLDFVAAVSASTGISASAGVRHAFPARRRTFSSDVEVRFAPKVNANF